MPRRYFRTDAGIEKKRRAVYKSAAVGGISVVFSSKGLVSVEIGKVRGRGCGKDASGPVIQEAKRLFRLFDRYFKGQKVLFGVPLDLSGTPFEKKLWREISRIPWGETITYSEAASRIGRPGAVRAVGRACGKNPVPIVIPCHRVVAKGGRIGGYSAANGVETKKALLALEAGQRSNPMPSKGLR